MRFEIGRQYAMKLECEDKILSVKGTVIWSILSSTSEKSSGDFVPVYRAGFKFAGTPLDNLQELIEVISSRKQRFSKLDSYKAVKQIPSLKKHHGDSAQKARADTAATTLDKRIHVVL
jgi:hypothetical protein